MLCFSNLEGTQTGTRLALLPRSMLSTSTWHMEETQKWSEMCGWHDLPRRLPHTQCKAVAAPRAVVGLDESCRVTMASFPPDAPTDTAGIAGDLPGLTLQQGTQTFYSLLPRGLKGDMARPLRACLGQLCLGHIVMKEERKHPPALDKRHSRCTE